jgi:hypothetical protein
VLAVRFLDTIAAAGYTPMFYASQNSMTGNKDWNMAVLNKYKVWVAQYPSDPFPITASSSYTGAHAMWQYTEKASIAGISGSVDMNVAYFNYDGIAEAKDTSGTPTVTAPTTTTTTATSTTTAASVTFTPVVEVITVNATDVNLRTVPSSTDPTTIVAPINPGDMIFRTGIGDNGWSQVILNGQILYIYSAYVTKVL